MRDSKGGYNGLPLAVPLAVPPTDSIGLSLFTGPAAKPSRLMQLGNVDHGMLSHGLFNNWAGIKVLYPTASGVSQQRPFFKNYYIHIRICILSQSVLAGCNIPVYHGDILKFIADLGAGT